MAAGLVHDHTFGSSGSISIASRACGRGRASARPPRRNRGTPRRGTLMISGRGQVAEALAFRLERTVLAYSARASSGSVTMPCTPELRLSSRGSMSAECHLAVVVDPRHRLVKLMISIFDSREEPQAAGSFGDLAKNEGLQRGRRVGSAKSQRPAVADCRLEFAGGRGGMASGAAGCAGAGASQCRP